MIEQLQTLDAYGFRVDIKNYGEQWTVKLMWPVPADSEFGNIRSVGEDKDIESAFFDAMLELKEAKEEYEEEHGVDIDWPLLRFTIPEEIEP